MCQFNGPVDEFVFENFQRDTNGLVNIATEKVGSNSLIYFTKRRSFVFIDANSSAHEIIEDNWPALACIGNYRDSEGMGKYESCIKYITAFGVHSAVWPSEDQVLLTCIDSADSRCSSIDPQDVDARLFCE